MGRLNPDVLSRVVEKEFPGALDELSPDVRCVGVVREARAEVFKGIGGYTLMPFSKSSPFEGTVAVFRPSIGGNTDETLDDINI